MAHGRLVLVLSLALSIGCGSGRSTPKTTPAPQPDKHAPAPASRHAAPVPVPELAELPPAPDIDSTVPPEELIAEMRIASDSAADEAASRRSRPRLRGRRSDRVCQRVDSESAKALVGAVTWDIDVATFNNHDRVQYYLDFFRGPGHERFGVWLSRMPRYEAMIRARLQKEGLPADLVYLALIESGFSNTATSRARAVGMWQFMKGTAKHYGLRVDSWVDERRDPYRATDAAARHLRDLTSRFGSLYLAAAAYNAGAGKVSRGLGRLPDDEGDSVNTDATFFRLYDTKLLRRETKDYVPKLIAAALIAKEPQRYGFDLAAGSPAAYDSIVVPGMTGLDVIARLADTTVAAIREMNPQYLRLATPPGVPAVIRIPEGRGPATVASYAELPASKRVTFVEHIVAQGQTMSGIASRYHVNLGLLTDANPRLRGRLLRPGQQVIVPTGGALSTSVARRVATPVVPAGSTPTGFHRVRRGETLSGLGRRVRRHRHSAPFVECPGPLGRHSCGPAAQGVAARPGEVSGRADGDAGGLTDGTSGERVHVVQRGETLGGLARQYGVSVQALRAANGLSERGTIRAGAALRIPG